MKRKKFGRTMPPAVLPCLGASLAACLGAGAGMLLARAEGTCLLYGLGAGVLAGCAWTLSFGKAQASSSARLASILEAANREPIELGALLPDPAPGGRARKASGPAKEAGGPAASLTAIVAKLNASLADICRAALKFELFAQDISFSSSQLAERSEEQARAMGSVRTLAEEYGAALSSLVGDFSSLSSMLAASSASYAELSARTKASTDTLTGLRASTEEAAGTSLRGSASIREAQTAQDSVGSALRRMAAALERADGRAKTAEKALNLIEDLAERTRLLATNASIEAAHAGAAGKGFAVIAGEIRHLAEGAGRGALEVAEFLKDTVGDIAEAARMATEGVSLAEVMNKAGNAGQEAFMALGAGAEAIKRKLDEFLDIFDAQSEATEDAVRSWDEAIRAVGELGRSVGEQQRGYDRISAELAQTSENASGASKAAAILSQLGTYLRAGGFDMHIALGAFVVDEAKASSLYKRRERREMLVYNLESFGEDGKLVGYLGDLSPSGLLLYAEAAPAPGAALRLQVRLPLSAEGDRRLPLSCVARRIERDGTIFRVGCSLEGDTLTAASVRELIDRLGLDSIKASPPAATPAATLSVPASGIKVGDAADAEEPEELDDLETLEEAAPREGR